MKVTQVEQYVLLKVLEKALGNSSEESMLKGLKYKNLYQVRDLDLGRLNSKSFITNLINYKKRLENYKAFARERAYARLMDLFIQSTLYLMEEFTGEDCHLKSEIWVDFNPFVRTVLTKIMEERLEASKGQGRRANGDVTKSQWRLNLLHFEAFRKKKAVNLHLYEEGAKPPLRYELTRYLYNTEIKLSMAEEKNKPVLSNLMKAASYLISALDKASFWEEGVVYTYPMYVSTQKAIYDSKPISILSSSLQNRLKGHSEVRTLSESSDIPVQLK